MNELILKNNDLNRLLEEGYTVGIKDGSLYIHNIPVLNNLGEIFYTHIESPLEIDNEQTKKPTNHVVYIKELPYKQENGSIILFNNIGLAQNVQVNGVNLHQLSLKPANGYEDYYQKMTTYINVLTESVKHIDSAATAKQGLKSPLIESDNNLQHIDTNASRANIAHLNELFKEQKVAIIGVGGTGSYILDLISRLPLAQIDIFDDDRYASHNFFRSPGIRAPKGNEIKSTVFKEIYSERHKNIRSFEYKINDSNLSLLDGYNFIFICIDTIHGRKILTEYLNQRNINYIDTGIGMTLSSNNLIGQITISNELFMPDVLMNEEDIYKQNIQIAEINALAASVAVIEWKKRIGYYWSHSSSKKQVKFDLLSIG